MKATVNIARFLVGALFIFSGLVKAIDPLGLAYKMQEFFEAWAASGFMKGLMDWLGENALLFSVSMNVLEVALGVALLLGWCKKLTTWLLLLLIIFFTFLTSYVLFSGKIRACGCFGDCIPLTPIQTFTKDLILLLLIILILAGQKHIQPLFKKVIGTLLVVLSILLVSFVQWYVLKHLPLKDCLPFKKGNNILELRKMPKDAVQDKFEYVFVYEKDNVKKEFKVTAMPDSTWKFIERKQTLVQKGKNNVPLINDFSLATQSGNDSTEAVLGQTGEYYLLFVKTDNISDAVWNKIVSFNGKRNKATPLFIVTPQPKEMNQRFNLGKAAMNIPILTTDATAVKTAARNNVVLYLMNGPVVQNKWSGEDLRDAIKK